MSEPSIFEVVDRLAHGFKSLGLEVPDCVLLKSHDEGMQLISMLHHQRLFYTAGDPRFGKPIEHPDGSCWMQAEIYGIKIRWPAMKMSLPKGRYVWT